VNIVISPDSYKGSFSATEVSHTIYRAFKKRLPECHFDIMPMADGGEGTVDALVNATSGKKIETEVTGPLGKKVKTYYGVLGDNQTVAMEVANTAGLQMVGNLKDPGKTTTYGLGELLVRAIRDGYRKFIIGLGGSATNDGGMGLLQALGVKFFDSKGNLLPHQGESLKKVNAVDVSDILPLLSECQLTIASDVENILCGEKGATYIYGPQKGLDKNQLAFIDRAIENYATLIENILGKSVRNIKGAGAAGGLGFAFLLLGASLKHGAALVAEVIGLEEKIKHADWVITGEGQSDDQTLFGKVPHYVAQLAKQYGKKAVLISGSLGKGHEKLYDFFTSCHSIIPSPMQVEEAMKNVGALLFDTAFNIAGLIKTSHPVMANYKKRSDYFGKSSYWTNFTCDDGERD
jgi:glycerate kinase